MPRGAGVGAVSRRPRGTAQHAFQPRLQLAQLEGFAEIVVGPQFQPDHAVDQPARGGQHDHRHLMLGPQAAQRAQAVLARQCDIEGDDIDVGMGGQGRMQGCGIRRLDHPVSAPPEVFAHRGAQFGLVIADDHARVIGRHQFIPAPSPALPCPAPPRRYDPDTI
jgi:hypothetical protein